MRIVLDTNVLVSAILSPRSISAQIIRLVLDDTVTLAISQDILDEVYRVIRYPKLVRLMKKHDVTPEEVDSIIKRLSRIAVVTPGELKLDVIRDDPSDNKFLACTVESEANFIVSGDHHLTELREFQGIPIVNPATFLSIVRNEDF
ncbi:MAG: putative toxin-antitoxin system toxin component, PIN family [Candidatus Latescibacteria bacterium]|nr:putative toxin-antitoxin system toxin component, PIN family [Candidatus Latescibacterota bacterium]